MKKDSPVDPKFEALLEYIKSSRTADFTGYKRSSLLRRISKRMHEINITDFADYIDYLEMHSDEFTNLLNTLLINVTSFFRDQEAWEYLAEEIIPRIVKNKRNDEIIRVWSAGCSSGEEPYSLAMLFAEKLGLSSLINRVKIYGTDIDEDALMHARHATYTAKAMEPVSEELRQKYFTRNDSDYSFKLDARRAVIFGRHDLIQDAPISKLDLLVCRNVLMYMNADTQKRVLARFHFALNDPGYLFLGKAELMVTQTNLFYHDDLKHRIFKKSAKVDNHEHLRTLAQQGAALTSNVSRVLQLKETAFEAADSPQLILDVQGNLLLANLAARSLFAIEPRNLGCPFQDLELSYRPAELRSVLEQCYRERKPIQIEGVQYHEPDGNIKYLDISVTPLANNGALLGASIRFIDVTRAHKLQEDLVKSNQELETTNEELQSAQEELETTNEELQSTNEELETTNEELQSTNEELETMNEELQSTNAELETINNELRVISIDSNRTNLFLQSILTSLDSAVIALDKSMEVLLWNHKAEDLWGLRADEVRGKSVFDLDIGLPVADLKNAMRDFLDSKDGFKEEKGIEGINRRGKKIKCNAKMTVLGESKDGLVLLIDELK